MAEENIIYCQPIKPVFGDPVEFEERVFAEQWGCGAVCQEYFDLREGREVRDRERVLEDLKFYSECQHKHTLHFLCQLVFEHEKEIQKLKELIAIKPDLEAEHAGELRATVRKCEPKQP